MKKILKIVGVISALILSVFGLSACEKEPEIQALYGVPDEMGNVKLENNANINEK